MKYSSWLLAMALGTCASFAQAEDPAINWDLDDAIRQIERQADNFDSAMAHVVITRKTADTEETEEGVMFVNDEGDMRIAVASPVTKTYLMDSRDLYVYLPDQNLVQEYYLPKHPNRLAPFLRLGFSTAGKDLKDDYLVSAIGERYIGDRRTLGIDLTPKKDKDRARVAGMKLWIDQASWMPVEQQIEATANGETMTVTFTNMARNLKLNPDLFKRKWPRGTDKQKVRGS